MKIELTRQEAESIVAEIQDIEDSIDGMMQSIIAHTINPPQRLFDELRKIPHLSALKTKLKDEYWKKETSDAAEIQSN